MTAIPVMTARQTDDATVDRLATGSDAGNANERKTDAADAGTLTNRQGHPISNNQSTRTVGNRGPTTLENYHFLEKITHFDRERIPERVVHARGAGAHGFALDEAEVIFWGVCPDCQATLDAGAGTASV